MNGYTLILASDLDRDGMGLELRDADGVTVAEVFREDATGETRFLTHGSLDVDIAVVRWLIDRAQTEFRE